MQHTDVHAAGSSACSLESTDVVPPYFDSCTPRRTATHRSCNDLQRECILSAAKTAMIPPEEFEALPASIQRKCFSPAERQRIHQQSQAQKRRKPSPAGAWLTLPTPSEPTHRPATSTGSTASCNGSDSGASTPAMITIKQKKISEEQARWFLMLPEKVRRQHFSRDEHLTLLMRCKKVLEPESSTLKAPPHRCHPLSRPQSCMSLLPKERPSTSTATSVETSRSFLDADNVSVRTTESSNAEMKIFNLYSRYSTHNDIIATVPPPQRQPDPRDVARPKKQPGFRKYSSFTPLRLPPPTLAPPVPPVPSLSRPTSPDSARPLSMSARLSRPYTGLFTSIFELEAEPVQQPVTVELEADHEEDVRKRLRRTVRPDMFEDILGLGFIAEESSQSGSVTEDSCPISQSLSSKFSSESEYEEDNGNYENDDDTSIEPTSPRTPTPLSGDLLASYKQHSFDSGIGMALSHTGHLQMPATYSPDTSISNRDVTVHIRRSELRSPEDALYSVQRQQTSGVDVEKHDPLALDTLTVCDDPTGSQGAFSIRSSQKKGLKGVWKTLLGH